MCLHRLHHKYAATIRTFTNTLMRTTKLPSTDIHALLASAAEQTTSPELCVSAVSHLTMSGFGVWASLRPEIVLS